MSGASQLLITHGLSELLVRAIAAVLVVHHRAVIVPDASVVRQSRSILHPNNGDLPLLLDDHGTLLVLAPVPGRDGGRDDGDPRGREEGRERRAPAISVPIARSPFRPFRFAFHGHRGVNEGLHPVPLGARTLP